MLIRRAAVPVILLATASALALVPRAHQRPADTYSIDAVHSSIGFRIKHFNISYFYGRFNEVEGTVAFSDADASADSLNVTVKTESVDTHNGKRDADIKGADFFNAAKFPTITFKSKSFSKTGENAFDVTGDLTFRGQTKPITIKLEKTGQGKTMMGERIGFETVFTIKRSEYGMTAMPDGLGEDVRLMVSLECTKK